MMLEKITVEKLPKPLQSATRACVLALGKVTGGRLDYELCRRSLWGKLPQAARPPADGLRYLALSVDLDYQADTDALPALLKVLNRHSAKMTVFSIGKLVEQDPGPYREAVEEGHEIGNHTWSHPDNPVLNPDHEFWHLSEAEMRDEILWAQDAFETQIGVRPQGFRAPHFKDAAHLLPVLEALQDFTYLSSSLASKCPERTPFFPTKRTQHRDLSLHFPALTAEDGSRLLMIPLTPCPEHRWSPFCSYHAVRRPANPAMGAGMHTVEEFGSTWKRMLDAAAPDGFASVYFDPMDLVEENTAATFGQMLEEARARGWILTTLREVERQWRQTVNGDPAGRPR